LGDGKDIQPVKILADGLLVVMIDWKFARLTAAVTTTSIILSSNKIQNGDVLVPANPDWSVKWPFKRSVMYYRYVHCS